ncbi:MAG: hypothetical protein ISS71_09135 [Phycisphaerae bacterium]|nr:hypothetical protein [Phycisphaerae bacterium]
MDHNRVQCAGIAEMNANTDVCFRQSSDKGWSQSPSKEQTGSYNKPNVFGAMRLSKLFDSTVPAQEDSVQ